MAQQKRITMSRLTTAYYHGGTPGKTKLMLIHGNASSSVFYLHLMERLEEHFEMVAPDLRCFGDSDALPVDATRGMKDFSDDIHELVKALGWDKFVILGWSMGGGAAMQYAIDHSECLNGMILQAPLSPFGFGGTYGEDGKKLEPVGLASGGGCANQQLVQSLLNGDREFMRTALMSTYVKPGFSCEPAWEEQMIDGIASTKVGVGMYPGNFVPCVKWPGIASGDNGICNTMSPVYCDLSGLADIDKKPMILWVRGDSDIIVSDTSLADFGQLGAIGMVPGWPGMEEFPPQPMVSQTRFVLEKYKKNGGDYKEVLMENAGHACHVEKEEEFAKLLIDTFLVQPVSD